METIEGESMRLPRSVPGLQPYSPHLPLLFACAVAVSGCAVEESPPASVPEGTSVAAAADLKFPVAEAPALPSDGGDSAGEAKLGADEDSASAGVPRRSVEPAGAPRAVGNDQRLHPCDARIVDAMEERGYQHSPGTVSQLYGAAACLFTTGADAWSRSFAFVFVDGVRSSTPQGKRHLLFEGAPRPAGITFTSYYPESDADCMASFYRGEVRVSVELPGGDLGQDQQHICNAAADLLVHIRQELER